VHIWFHSLRHFEVNQSYWSSNFVSHIINGLRGIFMAFLVIPNDQYNMKSNDKLHYKIQASQSHDKWRQSKFGNDAATWLESFVSCKIEMYWKPEANYVFLKSKKWKIHSSTTFRCSGESSAFIISRIISDQAMQIYEPNFTKSHSGWNWVSVLEYETRLAY